jgi:hypothetical protein
MDLKKIIKEVLLKNLKENNFFDDEYIEKWISGECIPFTVALNEIFPTYNIAVLNDQFDDVDEDSEYDYNFVHAFCYDPNNHNIIIDAKGVRKLKDLYEEFHDINPVIDWDIYDSQYLINNYAGKEFASEESFEYDITEYQEAKEWILKNIESYQIGINEIINYKRKPTSKTHDDFAKDKEKFNVGRYKDYLKTLDDYHHKIYNKKFLTPEEIDDAVFIAYELYKMKKPAPIHIYNTILSKLKSYGKISEYNYNVLISTNERLY